MNQIDYVSRPLTHWGRVTHLCVSKLAIIGSVNGLSPHRRQAIIWTNAGILLIGPLETKFSRLLIEIHTFSFKKVRLKMSSWKWRPSCLGLNVLTSSYAVQFKFYIMEPPYNTVSYNTIFHIHCTWHWQILDIDHIMNPKKTTHTYAVWSMAVLNTEVWLCLPIEPIGN